MNENEKNELLGMDRHAALKLPLWKGVLEKMVETAKHGDTFRIADFEEQLKCRRDTVQFGVAMSRIRKGLEFYGMSLCQREGQMVILLPEDNARVMELFNLRAVRSLKRAVILGGSTPMDGLTDSQRRAHEKQLERSSFRLALMRQKTQRIEGEKRRIGK